MLFTSNKYTNWYYQIIESARQNPPSGYYENHHIIPRSLGGSNDPDNLVALTAREHFLCHWLLTKMVEGNARHKMLCALTRMMYGNDTQQRHRVSARTYESIRSQWAKAHRELMQSEEMRTRISEKLKGRPVPQHVIEFRKGRKPWNKGMTMSDEHCKKLSESHVGITHTDETKEKMSKTRTGMRKSKAHRKALSKSALGRINSEEHKQKISNSIKSKPKLECSNCGRTFLDVGANFKRHQASCINS